MGPRCTGLKRLADRLETPMVVLAFAWLGLTIADMGGYDPPWVNAAENAIWVIFVIDFLLRLWLARNKLVYLRHNWITLLSLVVPALRIARIARLVRVARGVRLFRVYASTNRGLRAVMKSLGRKGAGYVIAMTIVVTYAGAAGMFALEDHLFHSYWDALWWTAMIMTTMGSEAWPRTPLGRLLCFVLAMYAFTVFGYVTATLASFLVGRDDDDDDKVGIGKLREELEGLRADMSAVREALQVPRRDAAGGPQAARE